MWGGYGGAQQQGGEGGSMERRELKSKRKKILLRTRQTWFFATSARNFPHPLKANLLRSNCSQRRAPLSLTHTHLSPSILALTAERNCDTSDELVVLSLSHTHTHLSPSILALTAERISLSHTLHGLKPLKVKMLPKKRSVCLTFFVVRETPL